MFHTTYMLQFHVLITATSTFHFYPAYHPRNDLHNNVDHSRLGWAQRSAEEEPLELAMVRHCNWLDPFLSHNQHCQSTDGFMFQ